MGSRRLGRRRVFALNKEGQQLTKTAGPAFTDLIGASTKLREGSEIVSEITIDLGSSKGVAHSFSVVGAPSVATKTVVGVSSSQGVGGGTHENAQIFQTDRNSVDGTTQGVVSAVELVCVETPTGGGVHLGLFYGANASASGDDMRLGGVEVLAPAAQSLGTYSTAEIDADIDNQYWYLVHSGATGADYTAGKFVLRLYGYNVFDDV